MPRLVLVGDLDATRPLLDMLPGGEYAVTLLPDVSPVFDLPVSPGDATLVLASQPLPAAATPPWGWLAWNRLDDSGFANSAYEGGALAVLPARLTREGLASALRTAFARARDGRPRPSAVPRHEGRFARGAHIHLTDDEVLVVESGIVATSVLHEDGAEALIALHGPGAIVIGHPFDSCCLQLHAHTDVRAVVRPWSHIAGTPQFAERLRARVRQQEAWAAVQARAHLHDRLIGLLSLLAETFGEAQPTGTLVDVRLTHGHLASAVGTTRATVTRLVGRLRADGVLSVARRGPHERFVLHVVERHLHA